MLVRRPAPGAQNGCWPGAHPRGAVLGADLAFVLGCGAGTLACPLAWLGGAGHEPRVGLVLLGLAGAAVGLMSSPAGALAAAAPLWAIDTGFVLNRFGQLSVDPRSVAAAGVILVAASVPSLLAAGARYGVAHWRVRVEVDQCAQLSWSREQR